MKHILIHWRVALGISLCVFILPFLLQNFTLSYSLLSVSGGSVSLFLRTLLDWNQPFGAVWNFIWYIVFSILSGISGALSLALARTRYVNTTLSYSAGSFLLAFIGLHCVSCGGLILPFVVAATGVGISLTTITQVATVALPLACVGLLYSLIVSIRRLDAPYVC